MMTMDDTDHIHIYNNKVKIFLNEHFDDKIKFSKSNRVNQSELVYSYDMDADTRPTKLFAHSCHKQLYLCFVTKECSIE